MSERVREILSWYGSDNPAALTNLARLLDHGTLAGTGKLVILPVDQGFEHGPARSFAMNPVAYDPRYHFELALEAGCNAYAAPLGFLEAGAREFAGELPLILKLNNHDVLLEEKDPSQALTASVADAVRLGCVAIGFTIYPGSEHRLTMYGQLRGLAEEAKRAGLAVVVWSYPRGSGLTKEGETALDVTAYAAHIAGQLGGTKTVLALFDGRTGPLMPVREATLASRQYARFEDVLQTFLGDRAPGAIAAACFGVAGPVVDGRVVTTNLPWQLDEAALLLTIPTTRVRLLNDLEATAHGVLGLGPESPYTLQPGRSRTGDT